MGTDDKAKEKSLLVSKNYRNVLIVRFNALSDVAMTVPVVYSVCAAHPDLRFIMLTQPVASTLFVNKPSNLEVVAVDVKDKYKGIMGMRKLYGDMKKQYGIDVCIDLQGNSQSRALGFFCRLGGVAVERIDDGSRGQKELTRQKNKRMFPLISFRERYREVFYRAGFTFTETFKSLFEGEKASSSIFAEITPPKKDGETWIAVAPFAKYPGKVYPLPMMKKVVDELASWDNVKLFLCGSAEEHKILAEWEKEYDNVISIAVKKYGFPLELSLLSHCDVMLSMDSANMHLASLVCVPVVSVWGATHPYCGYMGWHQDMRDVVQLNMICRPCSVFGDKKCWYNDFFCLNGISPALIISHIKEALERNKK